MVDGNISASNVKYIPYSHAEANLPESFTPPNQVRLVVIVSNSRYYETFITIWNPITGDGYQINYGSDTKANDGIYIGVGPKDGYHKIVSISKTKINVADGNNSGDVIINYAGGTSPMYFQNWNNAGYPGSNILIFY